MCTRENDNNINIFIYLTKYHFNRFAQLYRKKSCYFELLTSFIRFKENGVTKDDVAIFHNLGEVFSRDFSLATQNFDICQLRPGPNCQKQKHYVYQLMNKKQNHPGMIIG